MFKVAFLFLTMTGLNYEYLWHCYFDDHQDKYTMYAHAKNNIPDNSLLKPYGIEPVQNSWANTMLAQRTLLQKALEDEENQWFIFVSESTIPLKDFNTLYTMLARSNTSFFHHMHNNRQRYYYPVPRTLRKKSSQWCILTRKHAQIIVNDTQLITHALKYPHDQEHYPITLLHFYGLAKEITNRMTTYVNWKQSNQKPAHPYQFDDLHTQKEQDFIKDAQKQNCFFARKFKEELDLTPIYHYLSYMQE